MRSKDRYIYWGSLVLLIMAPLLIPPNWIDWIVEVGAIIYGTTAAVVIIPLLAYAIFVIITDPSGKKYRAKQEKQKTAD